MGIDQSPIQHDQFEDSDYERFSSGLTDARRRRAEREAPAPTVDVVVGQLSNSVQVQKDLRGEWVCMWGW